MIWGVSLFDYAVPFSVGMKYTMINARKKNGIIIDMRVFILHGLY